jgi:hypothetical protein
MTTDRHLCDTSALTRLHLQGCAVARRKDLDGIAADVVTSPRILGAWIGQANDDKLGG